MGSKGGIGGEQSRWWGRIALVRVINMVKGTAWRPFQIYDSHTIKGICGEVARVVVFASKLCYLQKLYLVRPEWGCE